LKGPPEVQCEKDLLIITTALIKLITKISAGAKYVVIEAALKLKTQT